MVVGLRCVLFVFSLGRFVCAIECGHKVHTSNCQVFQFTSFMLPYVETEVTILDIHRHCCSLLFTEWCLYFDHLPRYFVCNHVIVIYNNVILFDHESFQTCHNWSIAFQSLPTKAGNRTYIFLSSYTKNNGL